MAKRKRKKKAKAAKRKGNCPECGGTPRGRGFSHSANCSKATRVAGRAGTGKRRGRPRGKGKGQLAGLSLEELVALKAEVDGRLQTMKGMLDKAGV